MKTYEVLEKALALIEDEKDWCQGSWWELGFCGPSCAVGAVGRAAGVQDSVEAWEHPASRALQALQRLCGTAIETFNDTHSHAEVVALFKKAIQQEKAKAGVLLETPSECTEIQKEYANA